MSFRSIAIFVTAVMFVAISHAQDAAAAPAVLKGYGAAGWGQSIEEVQAKVPDLAELRKSGLFAEYKAEGEAPIVQAVYRFFADHLCHVMVSYKLGDAPADGQDETGLTLIKEMLQKKYYQDDAVRDQLSEASISINAFHGVDGQVNVAYANREIRVQAEEEIEQERRRRIEEARKESGDQRLKNMEEAGVFDSL